METPLIGTDFYELDADWSAAERDVIDRTRRFVDDVVLPRMPACHNDEVFPRDLLPACGALGVLAPMADGGADPILYGLAMRELERGSSALRSLFSVQGGLVMHAIAAFGSEDHKKCWLKPLSTFEAMGCFALTEPNFGSNPAGMETIAEATSDGFRITGHKRWATGGTTADIAIVWAKLEGKVHGFLVELDRPGIEPQAIKGKWSFRSSETAEIFFRGADVPKSALLPGARSLGAAIACLNQARYSIVWGTIGAAQGCLDETIAYLKARPQFEGKPLTAHQLVQNKLAWMATDLTAMQLIAKRLGELKRAGRVQSAQVSLAKMNNSRKALEIARTCRELLGANGILTDYHVGRRMVDLETVITYEGTEHIHSLVIGEALTGSRAYS